MNLILRHLEKSAYCLSADVIENLQWVKIQTSSSKGDSCVSIENLSRLKQA